MSDLERIAYDNAVRALDKQERVVEELRARTAVLLASSSLAVSLLGGKALDHPRPVALSVVAMLAFTVSLFAGVIVLLPRRFVFSMSGRIVLEQLHGVRRETAEIHRWLTYELHATFMANDALIRPMTGALRLSAWGLVLELVALMTLIGGRL